MAKVDTQQNVYYPSKMKTGELHDDFRQLFDHVYSLQRTNQSLQSRLDDMEKSHKGLAQQVANGPSTTKIQGFNVHATPPSNGQKLTFNSAKQEIEWQ